MGNFTSPDKDKGEYSIYVGERDANSSSNA